MPCPHPQISFLIPIYNHLAQTQAMLVSLAASLPAGLNHEIILIDDGSSDGTREWLRTLNDHRIKPLLNDRNLGYAATNNAGARLARGDLLALLNNDLLFTPGWLEPMLETLERRGGKAGIMGNLQVRVDDGGLDHAGVRLTPAGQFEHIQILPSAKTPHGKVLAVTGACMLLRRADFEAVGGFDERYRNGCEDLDLCFKLHAAGKTIYVAHQSCIRHHVSLSRDRNSLINEQNSRYLFGRWRKEIKRELARLWVPLLQAGPVAYADLIHGQLSSEFLATPQAAALSIAESVLAREECRWARELDGADPTEGGERRCRSRGLRRLAHRHGYTLVGDSAELAVAGLRGARNFYVCGVAVQDFAQRPVALTLRVNGLQEQTFHLTEGTHFNVGIIDPILLPAPINRFQIEVGSCEAPRLSGGEIGSDLVITHVVIDDRVIRALH